ncbi:MAG: putative lipid II flippase FtsW [Peptococcaceae bacterium]|nr:putative lipid II flippase FtsW [Peptococcaceae bacterium]
MREKRHAPDYLLLAIVMALIGMGVVMVFSASTSVSHRLTGNPWFYIHKQLTWVFVGSIAMYFASHINYWKWQQLADLGIIVTVLVLVMVWVPGLGISVKGSSRWVDLGFTTMQPSEVAKVTLMVWSANMLATKPGRIKLFFKGTVPILAVTGLICGLVLLQPDLGTAVAIAWVVCVVLFAAGLPWGQIIATGSVGLGAIALAILVAPYRMARFMSFLDPWKDPSDTGYQIIQSLYAIGPGGLFGRGLGKSFQKQFFLPEPHNDFIFSVTAEELGFIGGAAVMILFLLIAIRGLRIAVRAPDRFSSLLATGITAMVVSQAIVNFAVVTGSMPVTGIPLPLVSYGGSSLSIIMGSFGVLLNISKFCRE